MAADLIYDRFLTGAYVGDYDIASNMYVVLMTGYFTGAQIADDDYDSIKPYEIVDGLSIYKAGGSSLVNPHIRLEGTGNRTGVIGADNITFSNSTITASGCAVFYSGGIANADKRLVCYVDFGSDKTSSNGDFTINWNSAGSTSGILRVEQG